MDTFSRLTDYFSPTHYDLSLTLERVGRSFTGLVTITGEFHGGDSLPLHAKDLEIISVLYDGKMADFAASDNDELHIHHADLAPGEHILTIKFAGAITDPMHGLYPCYFEVNGEKKELLATQFESHHAREVFPCVDEPAGKATFDLTLTTEEGVTVLANMPTKWQRVEPAGLVTCFNTTPKMSPYLLAWVVGELQKKTATTKSGVEVNVWSTPAHPTSSLDFALTTAVDCIEFYDEYFKTPYPLPKCDHVALPDFSSGAMENWGLITYRETCLLTSKNTSIAAKRYAATVIAHELSHQWFGNLVTMQWWDDLWLNESFANMMEYLAVDALHPEWHVWRDFSNHEAILAYRRDALDGVQSVHVDVRHPDEISALFDGAIVYAKGGRLLRMVQQYIGETAFRDGLRDYFATYAYGNTVGEDLWNKLGAASGKDIAEFMHTWVNQSGYPVVHAAMDQVSQTQFFVGPHVKSEKLWPIPLNSTDPQLPTLLEKQTQNITPTQPYRLNNHDTAQFITHYSDELRAAIIADIKNGVCDEITRLQILNEQTLLTRGEILSTAALLPLLQAYASESDESVWSSIAGAIGEIRQIIQGHTESSAQLKHFVGSLARAQYDRLGWEPVSGESEDDTNLRGTIISLMLYSEDTEIINTAHARYHARPLDELDPELRSLLITNEVRHYDESGSVVSSLLAEYTRTTDNDVKQDIAVGICATRRPESIRELLAAIKDTAIIRPQDVYYWFAYLVRGQHSRELAWQWLQDNWDWVEANFSGDKTMDSFPRYAASSLRTPEQLAQYREFFAPKKSDPALTRVITVGEGEIEGRVAHIAHELRALTDALAKL